MKNVTFIKIKVLWRSLAVDLKAVANVKISTASTVVISWCVTVTLVPEQIHFNASLKKINLLMIANVLVLSDRDALMRPKRISTEIFFFLVENLGPFSIPFWSCKTYARAWSCP